MDIGVIEAPTIKELFIKKIAGMIISGELAPGEKLPSERELAAQARISKSAVHFAMAELERLGFVATNARHGTYVCDYTKTGTIETLDMLLKLSGDSFLDREHMEDMLEMRIAIEGKALDMVAKNLTPESLAALERDVAVSKTVAETQTEIRPLAVCFFDFHHDICVASGNFILPLLFNSFRTVTLVYWERAIRGLGKKRCVELMEEFLDVIRRRDGTKSLDFLRAELQMFLQFAGARY